MDKAEAVVGEWEEASGGYIRESKKLTLKWVEAVPEQARPSPAMCALVVHLPGGARMEVGDASQVAIAAGLLRALGAGGAGC